MAKETKKTKVVFDPKPYLERISKLGGEQGAIAKECLRAMK